MLKQTPLFWLICFIFFLLPGSLFSQTVDVCLRVEDNTVTVSYIANQDFNVIPNNLWSSQVITLRYSSNYNVAFSNFQDLSSMQIVEDGATSGAGINAGDGFFYKKFSNSSQIYVLNFNAGDTIDIFSIDVEVLDCGDFGTVAFELINGATCPPFPCSPNDWVCNNNGCAAVFNLGAFGNIFNSYINCGNNIGITSQPVSACLEATGNRLSVKYTSLKSFVAGLDTNWGTQVLTLRYPDTLNINFQNFINTTTLDFQEDPGTPGPGVNGGDGFFYKIFANDGSLKHFEIMAGDTTEVFTIDVDFLTGNQAPFQLITGNAWTSSNNGDATITNVGGGGNVFCEFIDCGDTIAVRNSMEVCMEAQNNLVTIKYIPGQNHLNAPDNIWATQVITIRYPTTDTISFTNITDLAGFNITEDPATPGHGVDGGDGFFYKVFANDGSFYSVNLALGDTTDVLSFNSVVNCGGDTTVLELITDVAWTNMNNGDISIFNVGAMGNTFARFIDCGPTTVREACCVDFQLRAFLSGPYAGSQLMSNSLYQRALLPGMAGGGVPSGQPYNMAPWNYSGTEGIGFTDSDYDSDVVDWILITIRRNDSLPSSTVFQAAALLKTDGNIELVDSCAWQETDPGPYYIIIEQRNHMGVMSPTPVLVVNSVLAYDFTTANSFNNGVSVGQNIVEPGVFALPAGDADQSDINSYDINAIDRGVWLFGNGLFDVYNPGDLDMNGDVNALDNSVWLLNNGKFSAVPK